MISASCYLITVQRCARKEGFRRGQLKCGLRAPCAPLLHLRCAAAAAAAAPPAALSSRRQPAPGPAPSPPSLFPRSTSQPVSTAFVSPAHAQDNQARRKRRTSGLFWTATPPRRGSATGNRRQARTCRSRSSSRRTVTSCHRIKRQSAARCGERDADARTWLVSAVNSFSYASTSSCTHRRQRRHALRSACPAP
jgi:hypothetical protein